MSRVLVIRFSSLGDVVLLSALVEALGRHEPGVEIWLLTKERYAPLYRDDPRVHRVTALCEGRGALGNVIRQLERVGFDRIYDAHASLRSRWVTLRLPPAPVSRIAKDSMAKALFVRHRLRSRGLQRTSLQRYLDLLEKPMLPWRPSLALTPRHRAEAERLTPGGNVLVLAPGARHDPKRWPRERYVALGQRFVRDYEESVVVVGGPTEAELCRAIAREIPGARAVAGENLELCTVAAVLERGMLAVCNDSGLMHVAEAVGTPVLALFGPTSQELGFFPTDPESRVMEHALDCRPCSRTGARACHMPQQWCMTRSTVNLVYSHLQNRWRTLSIRRQLASTSQAS